MSNADTTPPSNPTPEPFWRGVVRRVNQRWIAWAISLAMTALVAWLAGQPLPKPPPVPDEPIILEGAMGWSGGAESIQAARDALPEPWFGDTPAGRAVLGPDQDVYLWNAARKVLGKTLPGRSQGEAGTCAGFGSTSAAEHLLLVQIANGQPAEYRDLVQEATYALARVEVANRGRPQYGGDGTLVSYCADAMKRYGVIPRGVHGRHDLTAYTEQRAWDWGKTGLPDDLEAEAKLHPVRAYTFVRDAHEAKAALRQGYPLAVGSVLGVSPQRDQNGFARWDRRWMHAMAVLGYTVDNGGGFFIWNSWTNTGYHRGPVGPGDPPEGGFWLRESDFDRLLKIQGPPLPTECIAFSDAAGFPARKPVKLDWFVRQNDRPRFAPDRAPFAALAY